MNLEKILRNALEGKKKDYEKTKRTINERGFSFISFFSFFS